MKFVFIGSCDGMYNTGPGSFSYEFRKGQMTDTVTVGFSGMGSCPGWSVGFEWQHFMFNKMDEGFTIKESFDLASAEFPTIADCVVFVGDVNLIVDENQNPYIPTITGPTRGKTGDFYDYTFNATDPDGDDIWYHIGWGDKEIIYIYGPYHSGKEITLSYTWTVKGTYIISCWARDIYDEESDIATLEVTMPRNKVTSNVLLYQFLERFQIIQKISNFLNI